jgi:hypothetical protein
MAIVDLTFNVPTKAIGLKDYTLKVERSTASVYTPTMRQEVFIMRYEGIVASLPYPSVYLFMIPMPQEDGTWGYEASSIVMHFVEMGFSIGSNHLTLIGLIRWGSLADYYNWIIAENFPQIYGYTRAKLNYTLGIPSRPGSVYTVIAGFWSSNATEQVSMVTTGLITDLTRDWMMT